MSSPTSAQYFNQSKAGTTISSILGFAGGFLVGFNLGQAISGQQPQWAFSGVGAGLIAISIPISASANKKIKKAVTEFNTVQKQPSLGNQWELKFQSTPQGIGLALQF